MDCVICHRLAAQKPTVFVNDPWCSDICRKKYLGELPLTRKEIDGLTLDLFKKVQYDADDDERYLRTSQEDGPSTLHTVEHWRLTMHDSNGAVIGEYVTMKDPGVPYLDVRHVPATVFGSQPVELVDPWIKDAIGNPLSHRHDEGPNAWTAEITQPGDEVRWFECPSCGAKKSGVRIGGGDE